MGGWVVTVVEMLGGVVVVMWRGNGAINSGVDGGVCCRWCCCRLSFECIFGKLIDR